MAGLFNSTIFQYDPKKLCRDTKGNVHSHRIFGHFGGETEGAGVDIKEDGVVAGHAFDGMGGEVSKTQASKPMVQWLNSFGILIYSHNLFNTYLQYLPHLSRFTYNQALTGMLIDPIDKNTM